MKHNFLLFMMILLSACQATTAPVESHKTVSIAQAIGETKAPPAFDFKTSHSAHFSIPPSLHGIGGKHIFFKLTLDAEGKKTLFLGRITEGQTRLVPVVIPTYIQTLYLEVYNEKGERYEGTLHMD